MAIWQPKGNFKEIQWEILQEFMKLGIQIQEFTKITKFTDFTKIHQNSPKSLNSLKFTKITKFNKITQFTNTYWKLQTCPISI